MRRLKVNQLKPKGFTSSGCRAFATIGMILFATSMASAQELSLSRTFDASTDASPKARVTAIRSDDRGIRTTDTLSQALSENARIEVVSLRSVSQQFGDRNVDRTRHRSVEIRLTAKDAAANEWSTELTSSNTRQDISQFRNRRSPYRFEHRTYSLVNSWRRELAAGWTLELFAGVAHCQQADHGKSRDFSLGGARLSSDLGWMRMAANLSQEVDGGGSFSSIYGSQLLRRFELEGSVPIVAGLSLRWDCGVAVAIASFEEEELARQAPVVMASAALEFRFSESLRGEVGYAHRTMLGAEGIHGVTGPMATAALTVQFF